MRASLIIAAGGSGSRFKKGLLSGSAAGAHSREALRAGKISKLFFPLLGKPLLAHTLSAFQRIPQITETVIAVPPGAEAAVKKLAKAHRWQGVKIVRGGKTRSESVWKALQKTDRKNAWVLVHDGARPFVDKGALQNLFESSKNSEAMILARKVVPTIKEAAEDGAVKRTLDRNVLFEAETPQMVKRELLKRSYDAHHDAMNATDESSLVEALGVKVKLVAHDGWNPKITTVKDFELAEAYLQKNEAALTRNGFGRDTHRLVPKRKMILGGVRIPFNKGPLGHSDGDALLHAVTDAILGAIGMGDIGDWFSDRDPKFKNIASGKILKKVLEEAAKKGWQVRNVDTVIILERPKLGPRKQKIRENLAKLLGLDAEVVSIKAKTAEGLGPEGEGLAVTCEALVTVKKF